MRETPDTACEVCGSPAGSWCATDCSEAPPPMPDVHDFGDALQSMITLLAATAKDTEAKNYVTMTLDWDKGILPSAPFRKVSLTFYREDGLSPHEMRRRAEDARSEAEAESYRLQRRLSDEWTTIARLRERITELEAALEETEAIAHDQAEIIARGEVSP